MLIRRQTTNLLQTFCEISFHSQVIFKSMKVADNISRGTLEREWVNVFTCLPFMHVERPMIDDSTTMNHSFVIIQFNDRLLFIPIMSTLNSSDHLLTHPCHGLSQYLETGCPNRGFIDFCVSKVWYKVHTTNKINPIY